MSLFVSYLPIFLPVYTFKKTFLPNEDKEKLQPETNKCLSLPYNQL